MHRDVFVVNIAVFVTNMTNLSIRVSFLDISQTKESIVQFIQLTVILCQIAFSMLPENSIKFFTG